MIGYKQTLNESITHYINSVRGRTTERQISFLKKAYSINEQQRPFSYIDFPEMSQGSFRQLIFKFNSIIEVEIRSRPCFYKIKGMQMAGESHKITKRVMGVGMIEILQEVQEQPATIHDIKIMFHSTNLHEVLLQKGWSQNSSNKGIKISFPIVHQNIILKAMVYPKTIQIEVGCSFKPIIYDISGVIHLSSILGEVRNFLKMSSSVKVDIPDVVKWIVTHYHFGKDGKQEYSGDKFNYTIEEMAEGTVRFYTKVMHDGKIILRSEQIQTPYNTLEQEIQKMIISEQQKQTEN